MINLNIKETADFSPCWPTQNVFWLNLGIDLKIIRLLGLGSTNWQLLNYKENLKAAFKITALFKLNRFALMGVE